MTEILLMLGGIGIGFSLCIGLIILLMVKYAGSLECDEDAYEEPDTVNPEDEQKFFFGDNVGMEVIVEPENLIDNSKQDEEVLKAIEEERKLDDKFEEAKEVLFGTMYEYNKEYIDEFFKYRNAREAHNLQVMESSVEQRHPESY